MNQANISKILSIIVTLAGAIVMFGWFLDIPILKSILPQWVTMKFTTALCFFLSGLIVLCISILIYRNSSFAHMTIYVCSLIVAFIMSSLLLSVFLNIRTGIEDLFVVETAESLFTTTPGRPSIGTMVCFISLVIAGFSTIYFSLSPESLHFKSILKILALINSLAGGIAILGYLIKQPRLYFTVEGISTAMAIHTAVLFCLLGAALFLISTQERFMNVTEK